MGAKLGNLFNRIFAVEPGEWTKLVQFGLFGFLLQTGLGVGFSAGDAAFLSHVGADKLPVIFMLIPVAMLVYTGLFSYFLIRTSIAHMVDVTLALLVAGGAIFWALLDADFAQAWRTEIYYALKLYLALWYIALYTLFWNFTDSYFDIQDGKRLFPIFAGFCSLGFAVGAMTVNLLADTFPLHYFMLLWSGIAFVSAPVAGLLRRRWRQIAESDIALGDDRASTADQLRVVAGAFRTSRFTATLALTLFVTLLMTNLLEYQYSVILAAERSEAELAALLGGLYAGASAFNLLVCLFVFNRLVSRWGARNVAYILPAVYFAAFGYLFVQGGAGAAVAGFLAYHGVLTSIEYNNQNLLFNAVPSESKRPIRTVIEGMCEPLASFVAGAFLLYAARHMSLRELAGIGAIIGAVLIAIAAVLRQSYLPAMAANMRKGRLDFGDIEAQSRLLDDSALDLLAFEARGNDPRKANLAAELLQLAERGGAAAPPPSKSRTDTAQLVAQLDNADPAIRDAALQQMDARSDTNDLNLAAGLLSRLGQLEPHERSRAIGIIGRIGDTELISQILAATDGLAPRERRAIATVLARYGEIAIPQLVAALGDHSLPCQRRSIAAFALAELSYGQLESQLAKLVDQELRQADHLLASAAALENTGKPSKMLLLVARAQRERVGESVDFVLELLALGGRLPNFDLLIVSLHSANAKVRANAIETIQSGVDFKTFQLLDALLRPKLVKRSANVLAADHIDLLKASLTGGREIEAAAAARALSELIPAEHFAQIMREQIAPGMPALLRAELLSLFGIVSADGPTVLDIVDALSRTERLGAATLKSLLALVRNAAPVMPATTGFPIELPNERQFLPGSAIHETASRHPDLALVVLRSQDSRPFAA